ncbi:MAG TPA: type II toxin-antitoxin system VapC family toxin [Polyangiaceae bacterium]
MVELRAVLDTAPLVAIATGTERSLGPEAKRLVKRAARTGALLGIPSICLFEVAQLEERGRLKLRLPFEEWCGLLEESAGLRILPLDLGVVSEARALPALRDPFDRLIAGTAVAHGVPLVTPDRRIAGSGRVTVVW